jgi:putative transposase
VPVPDVCRKYGVSEHTFCRWRKKYGGLESGELRRLKQLKDENRKLKQWRPTCPWTSACSKT